MHETLILALAWVAGVALGAIFFGGLWWTVRKAVVSTRPAVWLLGSLLLRMGVVLAGFYLVLGHQWERMLPCLLGFVMARMAVTRLTRPSSENQTGPSGENQPRPVQEANHAH